MMTAKIRINLVAIDLHMNMEEPLKAALATTASK